jgi:hypothetical protein
MKKFLLIGLILVILLLAMPQGVMAATTQTATVSGSLATVLELRKTDMGTTGWALASGTPTVMVDNVFSAPTPAGKGYLPINLQIETNGKWDVTASTTTSGKMTSANRGGVALQDVIDITTDDTNIAWSPLSVPVSIKSSPSYGTGITNIYRDLKQGVYSTDPVADDYSITITFTATNVP